ncbi:MAG: hypothetical protein HFJ38_07785 [Bacilli bacterium]|nr:hypothetical protein [Bacilli bacterium]
MIQKIYEFLLVKSLNKIKLYNFLVRAFPKQNEIFVNRLDEEVSKVFIPREDLDRMTHNVWQGLCDKFPELDRSKF